MTTTTQASGKKATYIRHSQEYKGEALKLAAAIGASKAARQLKLHESQLYQGRKDSEHAKPLSEREAALAAENGRLKRQPAQQAEELSILKNAATYFAQQLKRGTATGTIIGLSIPLRDVRVFGCLTQWLLGVGAAQTQPTRRTTPTIG